MEHEPQTLDGLQSWIESEIERLVVEAEQLLAEIAEAEQGLAAIGYHPNHDKYALGGVLAAAGLTAEHIGFVHWWLAQPWAQALGMLANSASTQQPAYLLRRLSNAALTDPNLVAAGGDHLRAFGLLVADRLPRKWRAERGTFGLGLPLVSAGLRARDREALAGLWTLKFEAVVEQFGDMASSEHETLADLLKSVLDAAHDRLSTRGRQSNHLRAQAKYRADCASFATYDAADHVKRWRSLPPTARQGFLAAATARALALPQSRLRTRGEAAGWLRDHGANLRFNSEEKDR